MGMKCLGDQQKENTKRDLMRLMVLIGIDTVMELLTEIASDFGEGTVRKTAIDPNPGWLEIAAQLKRASTEISRIVKRMR